MGVWLCSKEIFFSLWGFFEEWFVLELGLERQKVLFDESVLVKLSPLQKRILLELASGPLTLASLSERTGSSVYTVGKQLSLLQLRAKYNPLENRGIERPLVGKNKDSGVKTTYFLCRAAGSF